MPQAQPELKKVSSAPSCSLPGFQLILYQYLDKRLFVQLNGSRKVIGVLRGFDVHYSLPFFSFCNHFLSFRHLIPLSNLIIYKCERGDSSAPPVKSDY